MEVRDADACTALLGEPVEGGGLWMRDALAIRPAAVLDAWLGQADRITATVGRMEAMGEGWRLLDEAGSVVLEADIVVVAAGWGTAGLVPVLPLAPVRGQANWVEGVEAGPVAWGGYAAPTGSGLLFGAMIPILRKVLDNPVWLPSGLAVGVAFIVHAYFSIAMFLGMLAYQAWRRADGPSADSLGFAVASGLIAGEGLMGVGTAVLQVLGIDRAWLLGG